MGFPALDLGGFSRRTVIPSSYITFVEGLVPGFTAQRIVVWAARIYATLRKRYAATIPFGTLPAQFDVSGTTPPGVTLSGVPTLGSLQIVLRISTLGALTVAKFDWSVDGGVTFPNLAVFTAAQVALAGTGLVANFSSGSYSLDNLYSAPTPAPETFLDWVVTGVSVDVLRKHGVNTQDPQIAQVLERYKEVFGIDPPGEVFQAANSKDGLFDLPDNDHDAATSISSGGPLWYSETSPYVSADQQEYYGKQEDCNSFRSNGNPPGGSSGGL